VTDNESVPTVGSRIGRYLVLREVAQGTLGPLFIAEREVGEGVSYGLARVVTLPSELQPQDEQALADAIWDSTHLAHDLVLRVADVVNDKGSLTLIHEHSEGSLLEFLQTCASEAKIAFPAKVASRVALDVIEGLEQSRDHCASAGIPWRSGSVSPGSLLLGPDGRVRAMDGQITAAALRVRAMRQRPGVAAYAAPEMLDDACEPSERSDVFAVGALLWELLTGRSLFGEQGSSANLGRNFKIPKVTQSVPAGTKVPQGLVHTVHTALEADPLKRQSSLRELAVAIVMGVEDVSTYEQVLEFTDALLLPSTQEAPVPAGPSPNVGIAGDLNIATTAPNIFTVESPGSAAATAMEPNSAVAAAPAATPVMPSPATTPSEVAEQRGAADTAVPTHLAPVAEPQVETTGEQPNITVEEAAATPATAGVAAAGEVAAQAGAPYRDKLGTLPGHGTRGDKAETPAPSSTGTSAASPLAERKDVVRATDAANKTPPPSAALNQASSGPFQLVHDEPIVPIAVKPVHVVGGSRTSTPSKPAPSGSNTPARPVSASAQVDLEVQSGGAPGKRTVQLSMGTLVFGILTTVLAVIVVMLVLQRSSNKSADAPVASAAIAAPSAQRAEQQQAHAREGVPADPAAAAAPAIESTSATPAATGKVDHHKHGAGTPGKPGGKSEGDNPNTDSKAADPPTNRHYIPNEL
jgi:serine/threonine protein kinase